MHVRDQSRGKGGRDRSQDSKEIKKPSGRPLCVTENERARRRFSCRLLTGDFGFSFLRRFGNVIKFAVSFHVTQAPAAAQNTRVV